MAELCPSCGDVETGGRLCAGCWHDRHEPAPVPFARHLGAQLTGAPAPSLEAIGRESPRPPDPRRLAAWRALRKLRLPTVCAGWPVPGCDEPAASLDHILALADGGWAVPLEVDGTAPLCESCHAAKSSWERSGRAAIWRGLCLLVRDGDLDPEVLLEDARRVTDAR